MKIEDQDLTAGAVVYPEMVVAREALSEDVEAAEVSPETVDNGEARSRDFPEMVETEKIRSGVEELEGTPSARVTTEEDPSGEVDHHLIEIPTKDPTQPDATIEPSEVADPGGIVRPADRLWTRTDGRSDFYLRRPP